MKLVMLKRRSWTRSHWRAAVALGALSLVATVASARECPARVPGEADRSEVLRNGGARVPRSALFSFPTDDIREAEQTIGEAKRTQLTLHSEGHPPSLLATVIARSGKVSIAWHAPPPRPDLERVRLSSVEALYSFVLRQVPLSAFQLTAGRAAKPRPPMTHGAVLATLAYWRECAVGDLRASGYRGRLVAWEQVFIQAQRPVAEAPRRVGAIIRGADRRPVADAPTAFQRGDHLACQARTGGDGAASCELFDAHGHDDHDEEPSAPTIVTFGGLVTVERILLPTTAVLMSGVQHGLPESPSVRNAK